MNSTSISSSSFSKGNDFLLISSESESDSIVSSSTETISNIVYRKITELSIDPILLNALQHPAKNQALNEIYSYLFSDETKELLAECWQARQNGHCIEDRHLAEELLEEFSQLSKDEINSFILLFSHELTSDFPDYQQYFMQDHYILDSTSCLSIKERRLRDRVLRPLAQTFIDRSAHLTSSKINNLITDLFQTLTLDLSTNQMKKFLEDELFRTIQFLFLNRFTKEKKIPLDGEELLSLFEDKSYRLCKEKATRLFKGQFPTLFEYTKSHADLLENAFLSVASQLSRDQLIVILTHNVFHLQSNDLKLLTQHISDTIYQKKCLNLKKINHYPPYLFIQHKKRIYCSETSIQQLYIKQIANSKEAEFIKSIHLAPLDTTYQDLKLIKRFTSLTFLDLSHSDIRNNTNTKITSLNFLKKTTQLKYLNLDFCYFVKNEGILRIAKLTQLQFLSLNKCYKISKKSLSKLKYLKKLKYLNIRNCYKLKNHNFLKKIPSIKTIHLSLFQNLSLFRSKTPLQFIQAFEHCHSIHLFTNSPNSKEYVLEYFKTLKNLKELRFAKQIIQLPTTSSDESELMSTDSEDTSTESMDSEYDEKVCLEQSEDDHTYEESDYQNLFIEELIDDYSTLNEIKLKNLPKHMQAVVQDVRRLQFLHSINLLNENRHQ